PVSQFATNGTSVQLTAAALGTDPLSYQWQRNGVDLPGATSPALFFASVTPANSGIYRLRVTNRVGMAFSQEALVLVFGPPTISDLPPVTIDEDTATGLIPFNIHDFESPPESIMVSGDSSDHTLVPPSNILFEGTGSNRTVRVVPLPNAAGNVTIFVFARD